MKVKPQKVKGEFSCSMVTGNGEWVRITVSDNTSGIRICEVNLSLRAAAKSILGLSVVDCDVEVFPLENLGKHLEVKTIAVEVGRAGDTYYGEMKKVREATKKYEVDGWKARHDDDFNGHRYFIQDDVCFYNVSLFRFVKSKRTRIKE